MSAGNSCKKSLSLREFSVRVLWVFLMIGCLVSPAEAVDFWDITTVDSVGSYYGGMNLSVAILPSGQPAISYKDGTNQDLKYAWYDGGGWQIEVVDSAGNVGGASSLAILPSGHPAISYRDDTNYDLKYAWYDGSTWQTTTVDNAGDFNTKVNTSLAILPSGQPAISYYDGTNKDLKYAWYDGSTWQTTTVDSTGDVGCSTSLAVLPSGYPAISYYDRVPNYDLKYAWFDGSIWQISVVDPANECISSLAILPSGQPAISYTGRWGRLKYALYDGSAWQTTTVDSTIDVGWHTSLAILLSGQPAISHYDYINKDLKYAWYDGSTWQTTTLDSVGDVGRYSSLAVLPSGQPAISYHADYEELRLTTKNIPAAPVTMSTSYTATAHTDLGGTTVVIDGPAYNLGEQHGTFPASASSSVSLETTNGGHLRGLIALWGMDGDECFEPEECWGISCQDADGTVTGTIILGTSESYPAGSDLDLVLEVLVGGELGNAEAFYLKLWRGASLLGQIDQYVPGSIVPHVLAGETLTFELFASEEDWYADYGGSLSYDRGFEFRVILREPVQIGQDSTVEATSRVPANGVSYSEVTITVLDPNGNPIEGIPAREVVVGCTGSGNTITGPDEPTNGSGQTTAKIASTVAEVKTVSPTVLGTVLSDTATIYFCESSYSKLRASDGVADDHFGLSVSIDGNTALVGAYGDDDNGSISGSAYIFRFDGSSWVEETKLLPSDGAADDYFGYSVAIDGNTALVGAYCDDDNGSKSGSAYIFTPNSIDPNNWDQQAKLTAPDGAAIDYFGESVSISGDYAIIGAYGDDDNGSASGSAYIFRYDGSNWVQQEKLLASDGTMSDYFGGSVAIDGNTALVGANGDDDNGSSSGSAYIFTPNEIDPNNWDQQAKLTATDGAASDLFGYSVSICGDYAIVGAHLDDDKGYNSGSAYIFTPNSIDPNNWDQQAKLTASDGASSDYFGYSVAIDDNTSLVGAYREDDNGYDSGSAYVFHFDGSSWVQQDKLLAPDGAYEDYFGYSVAINGNNTLVGASGDDDVGTDSGSAYLFDISGYLGDLDADGDTDLFDFSILAGQWLQLPGQPSADIAPCGGDCIIDFSDLKVLCDHWLE